MPSQSRRAGETEGHRRRWSRAECAPKLIFASSPGSHAYSVTGLLTLTPPICPAFSARHVNAGAAALLRAAGATTKVLDQIGEVAVVGREARQPLGITERRRDLSSVAVEADKRQQRIAIVRVARQ